MLSMLADKRWRTKAANRLRWCASPTIRSVIGAPAPGAFWWVTFVITQATLAYDLGAPLASPRWLDGFAELRGYEDRRGLCAIVDLRYLVAATGSSTPAGWAALPVLQPGVSTGGAAAAAGAATVATGGAVASGASGRNGALFVASGVYQLPLFRGVPSMALLVEMRRSGDVEGTLARALKARWPDAIADTLAAFVLASRLLRAHGAAVTASSTGA
jgi:hypothetical protein